MSSQLLHGNKGDEDEKSLSTILETLDDLWVPLSSERLKFVPDDDHFTSSRPQETSSPFAALAGIDASALGDDKLYSFAHVGNDFMDKESISGFVALNIVENSLFSLRDDGNKSVIGTEECVAMINQTKQKSRSTPLSVTGRGSGCHQLDLDSVLDAKGKEVMQSDCGEEGEGSRKHRHNAKERLRRMTLHSSYLSLGELLPVSRRSKKKRWSAPVILDRILAYIPELEKEIEKLTLRKKEMTLGIDIKQSQISHQETPKTTVSVHAVKKDEAILQICFGNAIPNTFSTLLCYVESEGMNVVSASSVEVCGEQRTHCYHLHVQLIGNLSAADDCAKIVRDKIVSFLAS